MVLADGISGETLDLVAREGRLLAADGIGVLSDTKGARASAVYFKIFRFRIAESELQIPDQNQAGDRRKCLG